MREYNASYNYFAGMSDNAVAAYQKDAVIGHRPTWAMGMNPTAKPSRGAEAPKARDWAYFDPLGVLRRPGFHARAPASGPSPSRSGRAIPGAVRRALDVLGLDETADGPAIKAQYKALVKRFHPDANGGDRSFEERLRDIIKAHDTLKTAGLC